MNPTPVKPGYLCTEFWGIAVATILTLLVQSGVIPHDTPIDKVVAEALFILGALGYHAGRSYVKGSGDAAPVDPPKVDPLTGRAV